VYYGAVIKTMMNKLNLVMKWTTNNTTLSEEFQNPI